mmetsp:Transcript_1500/g.3055  ORF Transcript_1500/g.3055 Transcript_1500/m.3055 type:complete len:122 (+) Transcript_1500:929-1294(+)
MRLPVVSRLLAFFLIGTFTLQAWRPPPCVCRSLKISLCECDGRIMFYGGFEAVSARCRTPRTRPRCHLCAPDNLARKRSVAPTIMPILQVRFMQVQRAELGVMTHSPVWQCFLGAIAMCCP